MGTKVISYSGDTAWTESLEKLAKNADLFICECNFYEREVKEHLNYKLLKENISLLGYKQIMLTHLGKEMLQNLEKIDLDCAFDGKKIRL
jgi:ribonuclease BN (tRNA processing enzyme)